jgi:hypothetical protein
VNLSTRRRLAVTAVPLLLLTPACGGGDGGSEDRATTVTAPSTEPADSEQEQEEQEGGDGSLTQADLEAALLSVPDLPTGYKQGTVTPDDDDSPTQSDSPECAERFEALGDADEEALAKAEAAFEGPQLGSVLEQTLAAFDDEDRLSDRLEEFTVLFSECPTFSSTDADGVTSTFTISPLSFPKLGDETVAIAFNVEQPDFTLVLNIVLVRVGPNLQSIAQGGLSADVAALEQAARVGTEKLEAAA